MKTRKSKTHRINRKHAALIVIDIQERLLPAIFDKEKVMENTLRLIKGSNILGLPVFVTEQYRKGLGQTVAGVAEQVSPFVAVEKLAFSACGAAGFKPALKRKNIFDVILCGIESHVCISQTCLDFLDGGSRVFVVADAVSSRTVENHRIAIERMRDAGATMVSTEMILFELLQEAGTAEFKQILALVK